MLSDELGSSLNFKISVTMQKPPRPRTRPWLSSVVADREKYVDDIWLGHDTAGRPNNSNDRKANIHSNQPTKHHDIGIMLM